VIDRKRHAVLEGAHPSPLSAKLWFGSRPFSQANAALAAQGHAPINWQIPDL
jgi:uracil-DNA glycosylase